jgi:hypothetical protein
LEFAVLWTIKVEFTPDGGEPQVRQIGTISRSLSDVRPEEVGLTLQEGRELLRGIECQFIANQVHLLWNETGPNSGHDSLSVALIFLLPRLPVGEITWVDVFMVLLQS